MTLRWSRRAVALAALGLAATSCTVDDAEQTDAGSASEATKPAPAEGLDLIDGSSERPYPMYCSGYRRELRDGRWYDAASMSMTCVGFKLRARYGSAECMFFLPGSLPDLEAVQQVVRRWARGVNTRNVGSTSLWGTVPVRFDNCEMADEQAEEQAERARMEQAQRKRTEQLHEQDRQDRCDQLEAQVNSAWRRWVDHSAYDSRTEDDRLQDLYRAAKDAWDRSRCR